jgi:hypothetical protein
LNHKKDHQKKKKIELLTIGSVFGTVLLVDVYGMIINQTTNCIIPFAIICAALLLMKVIFFFLLNLSKSNSSELLLYLQDILKAPQHTEQ